MVVKLSVNSFYLNDKWTSRYRLYDSGTNWSVYIPQWKIAKFIGFIICLPSPVHQV